MLMKVNSKTKLHLVSLIAVCVLTSLIPSHAHARGEKFLFAYPEAVAEDIKTDVEGNKKSNSVMSRAAVWVKDGVFKDVQFKLPFSSSRQNNNEREYVYAQTYDCINSGLVQGSVIPREGLKFYKVTIAARVKLDSNFNNKNPTGFAAVPELIIKEGNSETKYGSGGRAVNLDDLPAACRPSTGAITLQNYQRLNATQREEWSSADRDVQRSEDAAAANPPSAPSGGGGADDNACASNESAGAFAWVLCPAISVITSTVKSIQDEVIVPNLKIAPLDPNDGYGQALYQIWNNIRSVANAAFVLIFLYIIFANTLSINVNAYTIKKMLPRLVAAAILVQFSFVITAIAIDIGNILGTGVAGLVDFSVGGTTAAGSGTDFSEVARSVIVLGLAGAAVIALVGVPTVVIVLVGALISLVGVVFTLVARKLIVGILVVTSAPALVAWVLPKTEKFFSTWLTTLIKIILMYPLIVLLFKLSTVLAGVTSSSGSDFEILLAAMFPIIAWFMMPMTYAWGGKAMNIAGGQIGNVTGRVRAGTKGWARNRPSVKAYDENKQKRSELRMGNWLGSGGVAGAPKRWVARTAVTGAPFGGRLNPFDGGIGNTSPTVDRQLHEAQRNLWSSTQKTMAGSSKEDLEAKLGSKNSTQAAAAAAALAEKGKLNSSHLNQLQKTFKSNPDEGKRALAFAKSQLKEKSANPVAANSSWSDIQNGQLSDTTRNTILQATTPKALGSLSTDGLSELQNTTTEDGRSMLSQIDNKTIEKALDTPSISGGMNKEVRDALEQHIGRSGGAKPQTKRTAGREGAQLDWKVDELKPRSPVSSGGGTTTPPSAI